MGRIVLICRLALRDLRHRPASAALLLIAIAAATTTLTLGLALRGTTSHPYQTTRAATAGPDLVVQAQPVPAGQDPAYPRGLPLEAAGLRALTRAPGVTGHSGPYPYTFVSLTAGRRTVSAMAEGRDQAPAPVDQPQLVQGGWVRPGEVVAERAFADAAGIHAGDQITLNGRSFRVAGIAVTAAIPPYPAVCAFGCDIGPGIPGTLPGLIWVTRDAARGLATRWEPLSDVLNLRLRDPAAAEAMAVAYNQSHPARNAPYLMSWQTLSAADGRLVANEQRILMTGSWLLGLLAVASVAVLVGGRMTEQTRRVGLLKAVGGTPGLVTAVLLAEHLAVALIAAAAGLLAGWLTAPLLTSPGAGLVGAAGAPPVTGLVIALVVAMALAVALVATLVPAARAARISTVAALNDAPRPPRRRPALIALSARLPVPLLLGLRLTARRPRRALLSVASIAVTATGIVAVMMVHARFDNSFAASSALGNPQADRVNQVMLVLTVALSALAAVNAILITWATVLDARHSSALARAFGATPEQVSAGLSIAQVLPATAGALLGIPGGIGLYDAVKNGDIPVNPPAWWLIAMVAGVAAAVAAITYGPARMGAHRPAAEVLQGETT